MRTLFFWHMFWEKWENPRQHVNNFWMRLFYRLMNYVISFQQTYVIRFWEPSNVLILSNYKILLVIPDRTCINFDHMVYYMYELRWASSDNTLKELDASGSFFIVLCIEHHNDEIENQDEQIMGILKYLTEWLVNHILYVDGQIPKGWCINQSYQHCIKTKGAETWEACDRVEDLFAEILIDFKKNKNWHM